MLYHKILAGFCGEFVRWLNDEEFIVRVKGKDLIGHKDRDREIKREVGE